MNNFTLFCDRGAVQCDKSVTDAATESGRRSYSRHLLRIEKVAEGGGAVLERRRFGGGGGRGFRNAAVAADVLHKIATAERVWCLNMINDD